MLLDIDRKTAPNAYELEKVDLLKAQKIELEGFQVYVLNGGYEEVCKLELIYLNGNRTEKQKLVANACNYLLNSGTSTRSSMEIMEEIDFYGAFYQHENSFDRSSVSVYTLNKYYKEVFGILFDVLINPIFPQEELDIYKTNAKQRFLINSTKNEFLARKAFNYALFGNHPYGYKIQADDFDAINRNDIIEYFENNYRIEQALIVLSGKITSEILEELKSILRKYKEQGKYSGNINFDYPELGEYIPSKYFEDKQDALQSAIRIGKPTINKLHKDYIELSIVCTILGGYFGSRLMSNIREDKGYTYGIGAGLYSLLDTGFFYIATEVGSEVCSKALDEIYMEISRLSTELVPNKELELVKNYLKGAYISGIENIFSHADKFKGIELYNLNYDYYDRYFELLNSITSTRIMDLARQYLSVESMSEVVIGKK